jgi:hypothetical protein
MEEIWKDIPGYDGLYQVSNMGNVKSLPKEWIAGQGRKRKHNGCILKPGLDSWGYKMVVLTKNLKRKTLKVHNLVALVFLNHKTNGTTETCIDHINNIKTDNRVENLQLISNRDNCSKDRNNKFGATGVCFHKRDNVFFSIIKLNKKRLYLGSYKNKERAAEIYQLALKNLHLFDGDAKKFRKYIKSL